MTTQLPRLVQFILYHPPSTESSRSGSIHTPTSETPLPLFGEKHDYILTSKSELILEANVEVVATWGRLGGGNIGKGN